ncbi:MAG: nascent polypeptide-associated complex protein [Candidatus Aenigmarchaeota archaeon]|nr:nascent polypeptide-associated complex protein [Candidatus Aenigmarchaeota archaeon]
MMPGIDPKKLEQTLKQLGMTMENVSSSQVIIKTENGDIVINNPQVVKTSMKGQIVYQISGDGAPQFSQDDINLVMEQTGVRDEIRVKKTLEETKGDVVEAIMKLKSE